MGNEDSKEEKKAEDLPPAENVVVENSSGFHVLEIHTPTIGLGIGTLILFGLLGFVLYTICRSVRKRYLQRPHRPFALQHYAPPHYSIPSPYNMPHQMPSPPVPNMLLLDPRLLQGLTGPSHQLLGPGRLRDADGHEEPERRQTSSTSGSRERSVMDIV